MKIRAKKGGKFIGHYILIPDTGESCAIIEIGPREINVRVNIIQPFMYEKYEEISDSEFTNRLTDLDNGNILHSLIDVINAIVELIPR